MHESGGFWGGREGEIGGGNTVLVNVYSIGIEFLNFVFFRKNMTRKYREPMFMG
jgi:hypothetical protein